MQFPKSAVLGQVLIETATVAWLGATGGMLAIALVLLPLSRLGGDSTWAYPTPLALAILPGAILLRELVAWGPVRICPLVMLRYE